MKNQQHRLAVTGAGLALVGLLLIAGCTTTRGYNHVAGARLGKFLDFRSLSRSDYVVRANVSGSAKMTRTRYLFVPPAYSFGMPHLTEKRKQGEIAGLGDQTDDLSGFPSWLTPGSPLDYAKEQAIFNALEKIPDADVLLNPRFTWRCQATQYFFYSFEKCKVTVKGKAITLKTG